MVDEVQQWEAMLEKSIILNLLNIHHFGQRNKVNIYAKLLLIYVHGGFKWIHEPIEIDTRIISKTTRLPTNDEKLKLLFHKRNKKTMAKWRRNSS